jgi:dTDP-4-dehydrorhamnose 3,5-epimerase
MKIENTYIEGVKILHLDRHKDIRGYFSRTWCATELKDCGFQSGIDQISTSFNCKKGTLRGMHYQVDPYSEVKIVRCTRGEIFDVVVDLRKHSKTYLKWISIELSEETGTQILVPHGCAHGFQTLKDNTEVLYTNSGVFNPAYARTISWSDPSISIEWPIKKGLIMSEKDRNAENYQK